VSPLEKADAEQPETALLNINRFER